MSDEARTGTFRNGIEYLTWSRGPKRMVFLVGGPGSQVPAGIWRRMNRRWYAPFLNAGYSAWQLTRRRGMPVGHSIADMADDVANVIAGDLGGRVDLVVGESFGGMIAQFLGGRHPDLVAKLALVVTGAELSDWGRSVDRRIAAALRRGDRRAAGAGFAEYVLPTPRLAPLRSLVAPLTARLLEPRADALVELEAEVAYDARPVLPLITAPTLLICGDSDRFFPRRVVEETAALIPYCRLAWYAGLGHMRAASSSRVPRDVLRFAETA